MGLMTSSSTDDFLGLGYLLIALGIFFLAPGVLTEPALDFRFISMVSIFEISFLGFGFMLYIPIALFVVYGSFLLTCTSDE